MFEKKIKELDNMLANFDWSYEYSDDIRYWRAGEEGKKKILSFISKDAGFSDNDLKSAYELFGWYSQFYNDNRARIELIQTEPEDYFILAQTSDHRIRLVEKTSEGWKIPDEFLWGGTLINGVKCWKYWS